MYGHFEIWVTEYPYDPEVVLGRFGKLLEALENTANIYRLQGRLLRERFLKIDCTLYVVIARFLFLEVAQT